MTSKLNHQRRSIRRLLAVMLIGVTLIASQHLVAETWVDSTGKFKVDAQFVALEGGTVVLKKANGATIKVPLARLDKASQDLANRLASTPARPAKTAPKATPNAVPESTPNAGGPEAAVREMLLAGQSGEVRKMWDGLPPSYKEDIQEVVHQFAQNMDPMLWNNVTGALKKAVRVLKEKKQFILGYPAVAMAGGQLTKSFDPLVDVLDAIANSDLTDLERLKQIDVEQFAATGGTKIVQKLQAAAAATKDLQQLAMQQAQAAGAAPAGSPFAELSSLQPSDVKVTTVSQDGDKAVLRIELGTNVKEEEFVKVEGKWVPATVATGWDSGVEEAKAWINGEMKQRLETAKIQASLFLAPVHATLDQLLAAQTQQQFNQVIDTLIQQFQGGAAGAPGVPPGIPPANR